LVQQLGVGVLKTRGCRAMMVESRLQSRQCSSISIALHCVCRICRNLLKMITAAGLDSHDGMCCGLWHSRLYSRGRERAQVCNLLAKTFDLLLSFLQFFGGRRAKSSLGRRRDLQKTPNL
jgi:hypothetical protein